MKLVSRALVILSLIFTIYACRSGNQEQENNQAVAESGTAGTLTFDSFAKSFDTLSLPYSLPANTAVGSDSISHEQIEQFFGGKRFVPAFGNERDLPDLATNDDEAKFFKAGAFHGSGFTALVIRKQIGQDNYYYLASFANGSYVDGLCIAFQEGDKNDRTERRAAINDDNSIQVMQSNVINGQVSDDTDTRIFVISPDGKISNISAGQPGT
jgi:hypothetical protein